MKRDLEALLFAADAPLALPRLRALFPDASAADLRAAMAELQADYDREGPAFTVVEFGGGWQITSRQEYAALIQRLYGARRQVRLSKAGLEVLAIIAYRQPITRLEIDDVRGVQSSGALTTLLERNLVTVVGRAETVGHPILYGTTREFLNHLGLQGLGQLPPLPETGSLGGSRDEFKQFALQLGQELTDADLEAWEGADDEPAAGADEPGEELADGVAEGTDEPAGVPGVEPSAEPDEEPHGGGEERADAAAAPD